MSRSDCDRNLLLGILALQNNFIDRHALIAAFDHWTSDKTRPLGDILVELEKLDTDQRQLLDALVTQHLKLHDNDPEKSLAAVSLLGSVRKELEQLADPDVAATLAYVAAAPNKFDPYATVPPVTGSPIVARRFRILRPHARGGLGEVYVAEDEELHREVALKEIQERHADNSASRSRFILEAEITGGLEHPGIVPVYGLGAYADGRPYYAMRFVRGDSLQAAIKRFHNTDHDKRDPGERSLELRKLLGRFIDVCNAIEYAHSRGVLHRDLKPGNIMLGKYGETLVVDWGLAKLVGRAETLDACDERTLRPASASGSAPTQIGSAVGTPQYMSPEQAEGRLDELGPTTDVYSLGATLYSLLTGHAAIEDADLGAVMRRVVKSEFPSPRQVSRSVPRALDAICLKAMAPKPADRYPSPRVLADDVEHWLADEPVSAIRERPTERAGRWLRRHRAAARAAAASLVLVSVVSLAATGLVDGARRKTEKALEAETKAKDAETIAKNQANTALVAETAAKNEAKAAIDRYVETVEESELRKDERFQELRKKLLSGALNYYQTFIEAHQHDRAARHDLARALFKVGRISDSSGSKADALAAFQGALALQEKLAAESPNAGEYESDLAQSNNNLSILQRETGDREAAMLSCQRALALQGKLAAEFPTVTEYQSALAASYLNLGTLQRETGDREAALVSYQRALDLQEKLTTDNPTVTDYQNDLAGSYNDLGILQSDTRNRKAALLSYQSALAIRKKLAAENPTVTEYQSDLAVSYYNLGGLQGDLGDREAAALSYGRALALHEKLATENPTVTDYQRDLAKDHGNLGILQSETGDREAALVSLQRALVLQEKLAAENPTVADYQRDQATSYLNLGSLHHETGDRDAALLSYQRALAIDEKLAAENPTVTKYQRNLAKVYGNLGNLQSETGDQEAVLVSFQRALALQEKLAAENPTVTDYQSDLAISYNSLGLVQGETGDREAALVSFQRALALQEKLATENPAVPEYIRDLANIYNSLGILQSATGDRAAALLSYQRALAFKEELAADHPDVVGYQIDLGGACCNLGALVRDGGDSEGALLWFARAAQALQGVVDRDDRHTTARLYLRNTLLSRARALCMLARYAESADDWQRAAELDDGTFRTSLRISRADALARADDHVRAAAEASELATIDQLPADAFYNLACILSICAAAAKEDAGLAERDAVSAVELLRRAHAAGFFNDAANVEHVRSDTDLNVLRERDDFRKFVDELPKSTQKSQE